MVFEHPKRHSILPPRQTLYITTKSSFGIIAYHSFLHILVSDSGQIWHHCICDSLWLWRFWITFILSLMDSCFDPGRSLAFSVDNTLSATDFGYITVRAGLDYSSAISCPSGGHHPLSPDPPGGASHSPGRSFFHLSWMLSSRIWSLRISRIFSFFVLIFGSS